MSLTLMYITNDRRVARIAESCGVNRIFVDMEYVGKSLRQGGMDTVQNHHTVADVKRIRNALSVSELLVRCNPVYDLPDLPLTWEEEIEEILACRPDYVMFPYFKTAGEVRRFLAAAGGRCKTVLLFETPEAVAQADEILRLSGIDETFIGLNDLSLGYHKRFLFELLEDGTVESLALKFRRYGKPFGFGGIAAIGKGELPAETIIREHYRLFSGSAILSRSFCNPAKTQDMDEIKEIFSREIRKIRAVEAECEKHRFFFEENQKNVQGIVQKIVKRGL